MIRSVFGRRVARGGWRRFFGEATFKVIFVAGFGWRKQVIVAINAIIVIGRFGDVLVNGFPRFGIPFVNWRLLNLPWSRIKNRVFIFGRPETGNFYSERQKRGTIC